MCQIGCDKLLGDLDKITMKDFTKYINLPKRLMSLSYANKIFNLKFYNNIVVKIGTECSFFKNGKLHREDGPAIESPNGYKAWWINGKLHREDGPAVEYASGDKCWYKNGKLHREDDPAVEYVSGDKCWYKNGKYHREYGPAVDLAGGTKYWYINGEFKK